MKIAGLDIGTTGCKITVFDEKGNYLDKAYQDYPVSRGVSEHEIDAANIMQAVLKVIKEIAAKYHDIAGIGVTSFGETFVMTDEQGKPLHRAMLYTDPRGAEECNVLTEKMGGKTIASITGLKPHEMYSISKMMWMKKMCIRDRCLSGNTGCHLIYLPADKKKYDFYAILMAGGGYGAVCTMVEALPVARCV